MTSRPADIVLFGGTGDLARKKILPALYYLFKEGRLPEDLRIIGAARSEPDETYKGLVQKSVESYVDGEYLDAETVAAFVACADFAAIDVGADGGMAALADLLGQKSGERTQAHYLATPPTLYIPIVVRLAEAGLNGPNATIALEKPIGKDLKSAIEINQALAAAFPESRTFRVDHYLGKATVQNLLALRFGNSVLEPIWRAPYIRHVQITVAEQAGVEGRHGYYDGVGALRDMIQNHILQLVCLVAMEPPVRLSGEDVRASKLNVVRALRPIKGPGVMTETVRGQYTAGAVNGEDVPNYGDAGDADTETFVAVAAEVNNWRWERTPFFLRTGKRMASRDTEIVIQFGQVPHLVFQDQGAGILPNRLTIRLQPEENIELLLMGSRAGVGMEHMELQPLSLSLTRLGGTPPRRRIAYERLITDWLNGDPTLFVGREEVEESWRWIDGIIGGWAEQGLAPSPYPAGSWGPPEADALLADYEAEWRNPEPDGDG